MIINVDLGDLSTLIDKVNSYSKTLEEKNKKFVSNITERCGNNAQERFNNAEYDGENANVVVTTDVQSNGTETNGSVIGTGQKITFIEFGAGVHYNSTRDYPKADEMGMTIGGYGKGMGKRDSWRYYDSSKNLIKTFGNPANKCMYYSVKDIKENLVDIAKGVFKS